MNPPEKSIKNIIRAFFSNTDNKLIFSMFFPILIEQLILAMMGAVHSLMLARIGQNAEYIVSAVNLVEQLNQLAYALLSSVSLGATVIVSQYIGAGKPQSAKATAEQAVMLGFALALGVMAVFFLFGEDIFIIFLGKDKAGGTEAAAVTFKYSMTYMKLSVLSYPLFNISNTVSGIVRGTGDAKSPMRISLVIGAINTAVAAVLIYKFKMDIFGAGIASVISRFFGAIVAVRLLIKKGFIENFANLIKPKILYIKQIMRIGIYQSVESLIFQFGRTITYRSFTGSVDIAANSVTGSIFNIASAPGNSMSIVSMALVGRLSGAGDKKQSYKVLRNIILMAMVMLFLTHLIFFPVFPFLISIYTGNFDPANIVLIRETIYKLMILNVVFMPLFWPASFILIAGMKGAGDVRFTSAVSITSMWLVRVLFAYILGDLFKMGVVGVWLGMFFDWVARGIFAFIRFKSKKWQEHNVI